MTECVPHPLLIRSPLSERLTGLRKKAIPLYPVHLFDGARRPVVRQSFFPSHPALDFSSPGSNILAFDPFRSKREILVMITTSELAQTHNDTDGFPDVIGAETRWNPRSSAAHCVFV